MKKLLPLFLLLLISCAEQKNAGNGQSEEEIVDAKTTETLERINALGDSISTVAGTELLANLKRELEAGGPENAVSFCNIHASPILDSLSKKYNCEIRRISEKFRNAADKPVSETDSEQLLEFAKSHERRESLQPISYKEGEDFVYYRPIVIASPTCLKCHGTEADISAGTMKLLDEKYPGDLARGYHLQDFRGAWKIVFRRDPFMNESSADNR